MKSGFYGALVVVALSGASIAPAWAQSVQGGTYEDNGGVVKVEFQSGGKAFMSMGPMSTPCTYKQSGKTVNLACQGDSTDFTVNDDGSLSGPPNGLAARLTRKKS